MARESQGGSRYSILDSRFSPLFVSVSLNEGTKDSTELLHFVSPDQGICFVEKTGFDSNKNLRS